jgi:hypothetical protein
VQILALLVRLDLAIILQLQRRIVDPLQRVGVSLLMQYRVVVFGSAVAYINMALRSSWWPARVISSLCAVLLASNARWPGPGRQERLMARDEESLYVNPSRYDLEYVKVRIAALWAVAVSVAVLPAEANLWPSTVGLFTILVSMYFDACDPKPPRPRRVRRLVAVLAGSQ